MNQATALSADFRTLLTSILAVSLNVPTADIDIHSITYASTRRQLLGDSVAVFYTVTAANVAMSALKSSVASSTNSVTVSLNNNGYTSAVAMDATSVDRSPTSAPVVIPPTYSASSCFAGMETVSLESGETKMISEVQVGDRVLSASAGGKISFSDVVFVPHGANKESALFVHITTESGRDVRMTRNHILPSGVCGNPLLLSYASKVSVNDCILTVTGEEKVKSVQYVRGEGVYTVVTTEEYIVVNGIVASPFGANHLMANLFYNIHRFVYALNPALLMSSAVQTVNEGLGMIIPAFDLSVNMA